MSEPLLSLESICKAYNVGDEKVVALNPIDLTIGIGDYVSISGPSGSGKSTLLSIIGLIDRATRGVYKIKNKDVTDLTNDQLCELRNMHFGFIFQQFHLIDELSVFENIALPLRYRNERLTASLVEEKVNKVLSLVSMEHRSNFMPNQLSGGQQQRIAIARALVGNPSVLLVDEPTGNLDTANGDAIMNILDELNENGTTICMVTHDSRHSDRAKINYKILDGGIVSDVNNFAEC